MKDKIIKEVEDRIDNNGYSDQVPGMRLVNVRLLEDVKVLLDNSINKVELLKWLNGMKESSDSEDIVNWYEILISDIEKFFKNEK